MSTLRYRRKIPRKTFFREWMAARALRRRPIEFDRSTPMVGIIGDYISDKIRTEGIYERAYLEFLRGSVLKLDACKDQVAVDVGANIGNHTLFLSGIFRRVIAFEPNEVARSILKINLDLNEANNVEVKSVGLSDQATEKKIAFELTNLGAASLCPRSVQTTRTTEVQLVAGDAAIDPSEPIGFIKIDIEGGEEAALKGLVNTIRSHRPIVLIEQWPEVIDAQSGTSPSLLIMQELGYSAWEITSPHVFDGKWGKLTTLLLGHTDYRLSALSRLDKREYPALIFTPPHYLFPGR
jgi:FkbM family methyltransferase